jgi:nicotinamidase-related amidase
MSVGGNRALLLMDLQVPLIERLGSPELVSTLQHAADGARAAGVLVIFARLAFRPGHPETSPNNRIFAGVANSGGYLDGEQTTTIHPELAPQDGDIVVNKKRVSAFAGSDLDLVLRSRGISAVALAGIATSGVVLSTYTEAADRDLAITVLRDGCADGDEALQAALLDRYFPRMGEVLTVEEWQARV